MKKVLKVVDLFRQNFLSSDVSVTLVSENICKKKPEMEICLGDCACVTSREGDLRKNSGSQGETKNEIPRGEA